MKSKKSVIWASIAVLLVASIVLAACGGGATPTTATEETGGETVAALPQGQELANAYAGMYKGLW